MIDAALVPEQVRLVGLRARKHIIPFELLRPKTVSEVYAAMAAGRGAVFMAGGLDLIDRMKHGETLGRVIALNGVATLRGIRRGHGRFVIGALTTHADIQSSEMLAQTVPGLTVLWQEIANPRVRHTGTVGGNLMSGLPHYDAASALLALDARATLSRAAGEPQDVGIDALADQRGALLESVSFTDAPATFLLADRSLHPTLSIYLGGQTSAAGDILAARIAIGCAYVRPASVDLPVAGLSLRDIAVHAGNLAHAAATDLPAPIEDGLASGQYRLRMIEVMIRRLLLRLGAMA